MTMPDPDQIPLAAEYALGVLDGDERADAMRRVLAEPAFAREVESWRSHFALLFFEWPEANVDADLEDRMLAALDGAVPRVVALQPRRNGWAWATGAATLVAASLVLALALRPERIVMVPAAPTVANAPLVAAIAPTAAG